MTPVVSPIAVFPAPTPMDAPDPEPEQPVEPPLVRPPGLLPSDKARIQAAIQAARRTLGPAVALLIERELSAWASFGFRVDERSVVAKAVAELLAESEPQAA